MIENPLFWLAAVPAVLIAGLSKGGFGGGLAGLGVPLMALVISPVQAAAVMLPALCLIDIFTVSAYRKSWDGPSLVRLIPAGLIGIGLGTATFRYLDADAIRLIIGTVAVGFAINYWRRPVARAARKAGWTSAGFWGGLAGYTSFVAHAGGAPIAVYLLGRGLEKSVFVGSTAVFFFAINYTKLIPYAWLGQFGTDNLLAAGLLAPAGLAGVALGLWLHRRVREAVFFRICYALLFLAGLKLLWDGIAGLSG